MTMHQTFSYPKFAYRRPPELDGAGPPRRPVVVVGAAYGYSQFFDSTALLGLPVLLLVWLAARAQAAPAVRA